MDIGRGHDNLPADSSIKVMSKAPLVFLVLASPFGLGSCGGVGQGTGAAKPSPGFSLTGLHSAAVAIVVTLRANHGKSGALDFAIISWLS